MTELLKEFQEFRRILCLCPCCSELVRVSELRLKVKGPAPRTWLDEYEKKSLLMDGKEFASGFNKGELMSTAKHRINELR